MCKVLSLGSYENSEKTLSFSSNFPISWLLVWEMRSIANESVPLYSGEEVCRIYPQFPITK